MTSDELADDLVAHFNALDDKPIEFQAVNPPEEIDCEAERDDWRVFVWPFAEREQSLDRGDMCREELDVDVFVHGPTKTQIGKDKGMELVRFLRESLRETTFGGFRWDKNETVSGVFDAGVLRLKKQFLSTFRATFYNFG
jgi:hypothetical protein